jgi:hypothetical protein
MNQKEERDMNFDHTTVMNLDSGLELGLEHGVGIREVYSDDGRVGNVSGSL